MLSAPDASALLEAGRAVASGDPLRALVLAGRLDGPLALTVRGIAYAQLGDFELARRSLGRAVASADDARIRARANAALVEIALGTGDPARAAEAARDAAEELTRLGDHRNAAMQRLVQARAEVLLGRLGEARHVVDEVLAKPLPPDLTAMASVAQAEIAMRSVRGTVARRALEQARQILTGAPHPLLGREVQALDRELETPIARLIAPTGERAADLFAVEAASSGEVLLVDACRRVAISGRVTVPLSRRPVLFSLLLSLARAWPKAVPRDELAATAFETPRINASHRSRLRVEIGRLRKLMEDLSAAPAATREGYVLESKREVAVLLALHDDGAARLALLLGDGAMWSAQRLAEHAGVSKRTAQRALTALVERGQVIRTGKGSEVRYFRPGSPVASRMLLLGLLPGA